MAEHRVAYPDRHTEEAAHRRVSRRESGRGRVRGQISDTDRSRMTDQQAEDAAPEREFPDLGDHLAGHTRMYELLQLPVTSDNPDPRVAGGEQHAGRLGNTAQHHRKTQVGRHCRVGTQQSLHRPWVPNTSSARSRNWRSSKSNSNRATSGKSSPAAAVGVHPACRR